MLVYVVVMALSAALSRFEGLKLGHWVGQGSSIIFLLFVPLSSVSAATGQSQAKSPTVAVDLADKETEELFDSLPPRQEPSSPTQDPPLRPEESENTPPGVDAADQETNPPELEVEPEEDEVESGGNTILQPTNPAFTVPLPFLLEPTPPISNFDTYRLGPGDSFFINVRQFPDLSFQATLDIQGNVIVPLQGVVSFDGLTLDEAEKRVEQIYNQFVVNPDVTSTLVAQRGVEVTVLGEVVRPGYYPLGAPQILTALLSAGGATGQADLRAVQIQRRLPGGQLLEQTVDLFTPLKNGQRIPDTALQDGDVIIVERLDPAALDEYDRDLVARSTLAQPTITVRILNYGSGGALNAITIPNGSRFVDALVNSNLDPATSKLREITLFRFDEEAGQAVSTTLNGRQAFEGDPSQNPPLQNNDVIIVNRTLAARITFALGTLTQPFRDILGFLLFFENIADSAEDLFGP